MNTTQANTETLKSEKLKSKRAVSAKRLHKISYTLLKQRNRLQVKSDPDLLAIWRLLDEAWTKAYKLAEQRDLVEARAKDKNEVCWTLFFPRAYYGEQQPFIVRTPNTHTESLFLAGTHVRVVSPSDASIWDDLRTSWKAADPKIMADRAGRIGREFKAWQERMAA